MEKRLQIWNGQWICKYCNNNNNNKAMPVAMHHNIIIWWRWIATIFQPSQSSRAIATHCSACRIDATQLILLLVVQKSAIDGGSAAENWGCGGWHRWARWEERSRLRFVPIWSPGNNSNKMSYVILTLLYDADPSPYINKRMPTKRLQNIHILIFDCLALETLESIRNKSWWGNEIDYI